MKLRTLIALMAVCIITALVAPAFSQEMPAVGTTIDKNNYKKYAHLIPEEWFPAFENGFGGLVPQFKMVVAATKKYPQPKPYLDLSAKNKGKYSIAATGDLTPVFNRDGLPFPDLKSGDKDFATKFMWNYDNRWIGDEVLDKGAGGSYEKRKGEPVRINKATSFWLFFKNRLVVNPKPDLPNPLGLYKTMLFQYLKPESMKNTMTLSYRYADSKKSDDTYLYLPAMRRVLRAESGQRSTPLMGSTNALDDFMCFDGNPRDFIFTLVKEQKVLAVVDSRVALSSVLNWNKPDIPVDTEGYEIRDVYVIDIKPKDPKYPQSRKRVYVDKESLWISYAFAYDRAGKPWKAWLAGTKAFPFADGTLFTYMNGLIGIDIQFGMATQYVAETVMNGSNFAYNDVTPAALLKRAR